MSWNLVCLPDGILGVRRFLLQLGKVTDRQPPEKLVDQRRQRWDTGAQTTRTAVETAHYPEAHVS